MYETMEAMGWVADLYMIVLGLCVGSFLNVCILRIPEGESVVRPRSRCPGCLRPIAWFDNLPVLSYLILRGRCRGCGRSISPRYPLFEAVTALFFWWVWHRHGWSPVTLVYLGATAGLIFGSGVDLDHFILPDRVTLGGIVYGLLASLAVPDLHQADTPLAAFQAAAIGAAVGGGLLWLVALVGRLIFRKDAMGLGDVKLLAAIGALTGWEGVLLTIFLSSLVGSIVGILLIAFRGREWQSRIPFGPFLALGAQAWMLGADRLAFLYLNWVRGPLP